MKKLPFLYMVLLFTILVVACKKTNNISYSRETNTSKAPYINKIYEFKPAPSQFSNLINTKNLLGKAGVGLVSLGGYGGYIVFGFDHSIINADGKDLAIYGNPIITENTPFSEPGIVCVMQDVNKNGMPDDTWYELAGSEYTATPTLKNYSITYYRPTQLTDDIRWTDNQGIEGYILRNQFHQQDYFPKWSQQNTISFTGTLLKNTLKLNSAGIITNAGFEFGYSDSGSAEYIEKGYNAFDIDWAVDTNGHAVQLKSIDFVKVYTGQNSNGNPFEPNRTNEKSRLIGEISTDFSGAADIHLLTP